MHISKKWIVCTNTFEKGAERQGFFQQFLLHAPLFLCIMFQSSSLTNRLQHQGISALIYPAVNCFTDRCESTVALSHCGAAANEPDNEKEGSNCNNGHCWDEGVHVLKEVIVVIVCNEDIGSNITQDTSSGLWVESSGNTHTHTMISLFKSQDIVTGVFQHISDLFSFFVKCLCSAAVLNDCCSASNMQQHIQYIITDSTLIISAEKQVSKELCLRKLEVESAHKYVLKIRSTAATLKCIKNNLLVYIIITTHKTINEYIFHHSLNTCDHVHCYSE